MSNLGQRVISAVVLAVIVLAVTWAGGIWFAVLTVIIGAAMLWEWNRMHRAAIARAHALAGAAALAFVAVGLIGGYAPAPLLVATAVLAAILVVAAIASGAHPFTNAGGYIYAALPMIALAQLRGADASGLAAVLFVFAAVWGTDIAAYFVGRAVGGPKLAPSISPGKTVSGAIGGLVGGALLALAVTALGGLSIGFPLLILALLLSAVSQVGDLFESAVKRSCGVKDSSNLIPGHGGVLDRVDGLVFAAVLLYFTCAIAAGFSEPVAQAVFSPIRL